MKRGAAGLDVDTFHIDQVRLDKLVCFLPLRGLRVFVKHCNDRHCNPEEFRCLIGFRTDARFFAWPEAEALGRFSRSFLHDLSKTICSCSYVLLKQ
jgi:hypothetical protein